ncbi:MAG: SpoIID/LytB domain-containing protein [Bacteroidota bacterium]
MRYAFLLLLALTPLLAAAQAPDTVRVRLLAPTPPTSAVFTSSTPLTVVRDAHHETLRAGESLRLQVQGNRIGGRGLRGSSSLVILRSDAPITVQAGSRTRSYVGTMAIRQHQGRLQIVNHAPMPDYVASVVASEYHFSEIEGIKAQAVLARTYAARRMNSSRSYDVDDHTGSQVYKGIDAVTDRAKRAALETAGERLYYGDKLADAVYSSSSGGHTADNETIWHGAPRPYLRGVPDPYDADAPDHRWTTTASASAVHRAFSQRFGGRVRGLSVTEQSPEGRIVQLELAGAHPISGSQFRSAMNAAFGYRTIRSTHVEIQRRGDEYVFNGRGFGHGVGMSQYGARGQARAGRSYREILAYYYQGTTVERDIAATSPPVATTTRRWPTPRREARNAPPEDAASAPRTVRRSPTPRREARATPSAPARRAW